MTDPKYNATISWNDTGSITIPGVRIEAISPDGSVTKATLALDPIFIGTDPSESDVVVTDPKVSRRHCVIAHDVARSSGGDLAAAARRVRAKALVVVAEHDQMVNPEPSKTFAKAMAAKLIVVDTACGHLAPGCDPSIPPRVRAFLDE